MLKIGLLLGMSQLLCLTTCIAREAPKFKVLRYGIINNTVEDALSPSGLIKCKNGDWVAIFQNKGDSTAGCEVFFVRSKDQGKTWSKPFKSIKNKDKAIGLSVNLFTLPNGVNIAIFNKIKHKDTSVTGFRGHRTSVVTIYRLNDDLTLSKIQNLKNPANSLTAVEGNCITKLKNGDLILPAYHYSKGPAAKGVAYGSGFFRSKDEGKSWGAFELAFKEPHPTKKKYMFNESTFAVKDDGSIVGFARVDSTKPKYMWKVISRDNGATWSIPVKTNIPAVYPMITRLKNGKYVMLCGLLNIQPPRTVAFLISDDGENYTLAGRAFYTKNRGRSYNTATGGTQSFIKVGSNKLFITFYACDPELPGRHRTYIDGNLVEIN